MEKALRDRTKAGSSSASLASRHEAANCSCRLRAKAAAAADDRAVRRVADHAPRRRPKVAAQPLQGHRGYLGRQWHHRTAAAPPPDPGTAESIAYNRLSSFGWSPGTYFSCLNNIYTRESGWRYNAENASGAYGIPQALPGSKMASAGADWMTNPATQIKWDWAISSPAMVTRAARGRSGSAWLL